MTGNFSIKQILSSKIRTSEDIKSDFLNFSRYLKLLPQSKVEELDADFEEIESDYIGLHLYPGSLPRRESFSGIIRMHPVDGFGRTIYQGGWYKN